MYYARMLKFGAGLTKYPLPPYICVVDKNEAFFAETKDYAKFYAAKGDRYDWDRAPSTPCPKLVEDILASFSLKGNNTNNFEKQLSGEARANSPAQASSKTAAPVGAAEKEKVVFTSCPGCFQIPYIYDLTNPAEEEQFVAKCREHLVAQMTFLDLLEKKAITEDNFLDVFEYWDGLFGAYVRNGRKSSEYFLSDIEQGKSIVAQGGQVLLREGAAAQHDAHPPEGRPAHRGLPPPLHGRVLHARRVRRKGPRLPGAHGWTRVVEVGRVPLLGHGRRHGQPRVRAAVLRAPVLLHFHPRGRGREILPEDIPLRHLLPVRLPRGRHPRTSRTRTSSGSSSSIRRSPPPTPSAAKRARSPRTRSP